MTHADFVYPNVRVTLLECPFHNYETRAVVIFDHVLTEESQLLPPVSSSSNIFCAHDIDEVTRFAVVNFSSPTGKSW
jgi:hypothetical protein